jgi:hypothetical protein
MLFEDRSNDLPLNSNTSTVNDAHFSEAPADELVEVFFHHGSHLSGLKRVQVNRVFNRDPVHGSCRSRGAVGIYSQVCGTDGTTGGVAHRLTQVGRVPSRTGVQAFSRTW